VVLPAPGANWLLLREWEREGNYFRPIAFDSQTNEVICLDVLDGRSALFAIKAADRSKRLLYADPFGHVVGAGPVGKQESIGSVAIFDGQVRYEPLVARVASVRDAIRRSFSFDTVEIREEDANGRYYLAFVGAREAGTYYRYDALEARLDKIGDTHANLAERQTARDTRAQFQAADGRTVAARVTLPREAAGPLPLVVIPSSTNAERSNLIVPFLVANGYAIAELPMTPFVTGRALSSNWQVTVADIGTVVRELVRDGTADPNRVCAVGADFGAYLALMSVSENADVIPCVAGIETQVQPDDSAISLRERSSATSASVLLLHRDSDRGARRLRGALEDYGMSVESVEYDDDTFDTTPYRVDLLARLGRFLEENLR
jgi:hypothetical protein